MAIYARKSRITNKGDSIGVQFKQCAEYAIRELSLDDDYTFINYEDTGLSGYYSDRPDFQRMLHDIEMGKIRAVVCYKLDRIGRKTADLLRLLDFLEKHKVDLLICSNNINTASGVSKIFIQIFAVVAEFERDKGIFTMKAVSEEGIHRDFLMACRLLQKILLTAFILIKCCIVLFGNLHQHSM